MPAWSYPHTFHDAVAEQASGVQVMDNFTAAREKVEGTETLIGKLEGRGAAYTAGAWNNGEVKTPSATQPALCWYMIDAAAISYRITLSVSGGPPIEIQGEKTTTACLGPILVPPGGTIKSDGAGNNPRYVQVLL